MATPMGGKDRGLFFRPEVGRRGAGRVRARRPAPRRYIVGALWSKVDPPPPDDGKPVDNNWRFFRSRSGHLLKFDDTSGAERIEIVGKGGDHKLVIDVSGTKIEITCSSGDVAHLGPGRQAVDRRQRRSRSRPATSLTLEAARAR